MIIGAMRERDLRQQKFQAALKGIDLDKQLARNAEEDFMRVKQRVEARLAGIDENVYELNQLGYDVEIEYEED